MEEASLAEVLSRGLAPRAVVVYGASDRRLGSQAARIAFRLMERSHKGRVALVNPRHQEVHGVTTVPSAVDSELAAELDFAVISVPREAVPDAVDDCTKAGIGLAVVTSAGFAESDAQGVELQKELLNRARAHGIRLIGPNCMGLINFTDGLFACGRPLVAWPGGISVVSQSGYLSMRMMDFIGECGQGIDLWVTVGNCADLGPHDFVEYLATRPSTSVVVLYLENLTDPDRLRKAIRYARASGTEVVVLKSGRTGAGSVVAASHTGALASPDVFFDVLTDETDCIRVDTVREGAQVAGILASLGRPSGPFVVVGGSGGDCVVAADACEFNEIPLAQLGHETLERVHEIVPQAGSSNPLDVSPFASDAGRHNDVVAVLAADPGVGGVVLLDAWAWEVEDLPDGERRMGFGALLGADGRPVTSIISDVHLETWERRALVDAGLAVTSDAETVWKALGCITRHMARQGSGSKFLETPDAAAESTIEPVPHRLPELDALSRLRDAGLPMVDTEVVDSPEALLERCRMLGYPVVIKGLIPGVIHKAERNLVRFDVRADEEAAAAWRDLSAAVSGEGGVVVVQPQLRRAVSEVIVATRDDAIYGLHVMVGGGGAGVEEHSDVAWARAPVTPSQARRLIERTRLATRLLATVPSHLDEAALPEMISLLSRLAERWRDEVSEIEINPLMVGPEGFTAVDAVITLR
jgi:acetate---CoA ligase (ADP-forming)